VVSLARRREPAHTIRCAPRIGAGRWAPHLLDVIFDAVSDTVDVQLDEMLNPAASGSISASSRTSPTRTRIWTTPRRKTGRAAQHRRRARGGTDFDAVCTCWRRWPPRGSLPRLTNASPTAGRGVPQEVEICTCSRATLSFGSGTMLRGRERDHFGALAGEVQRLRSAPAVCAKCTLSSVMPWMTSSGRPELRRVR